MRGEEMSRPTRKKTKSNSSNNLINKSNRPVACKHDNNHLQLCLLSHQVLTMGRPQQQAVVHEEATLQGRWLSRLSILLMLTKMRIAQPCTGQAATEEQVPLSTGMAHLLEAAMYRHRFLKLLACRSAREDSAHNRQLLRPKWRRVRQSLGLCRLFQPCLSKKCCSAVRKSARRKMTRSIRTRLQKQRHLLLRNSLRPWSRMKTRSALNDYAMNAKHRR